MYSFAKNFRIDRPQQEVFDFMADPANDAKWRDSAVSAEWVTDGPVGVGSKLKTVDKLMGRKIESTSEITAYDPPHKYGQKAVGGPMPFEFTVTFEPDGEGTKLTMSGQAELGGIFKLAEGLAGKQLEKQIDADFKGLKRFLEEGKS